VPGDGIAYTGNRKNWQEANTFKVFPIIPGMIIDKI
jgi:hypothetical protein